MPTFSYVAMDSRGKESKGTLDLPSQNEAIGRLKEMGYFPTKLFEIKSRKAQLSQRTGPLRSTIRIPGIGGGVKTKVLTEFTRELATLAEAGLPLLRALRVLAQQEHSPVLKATILQISESIEGGDAFSEALSRHPRVFNRLYINMVTAGEIGGVLDAVLNRLADYMEKAQKIKGKVVAAMVYPISVLFVAVAIMAILMVFVVPRFKDIFHDLSPGKPLPAFTRFVLGISDGIAHHFLAVAILSTLLGAGCFYFTRTRFGRGIWDRIKLNMPILGVVIRKAAISRFTSTLGTLLSSGVPILQALTIVKETAGNTVIANAVAAVHDSVKEGEIITAPLHASGVFPPSVISMVDVGEQTGALPEMLTRLSDKYDHEVDNAVTAMTSLLEPIFIVVLAVIVGSIVIALFLPLISIDPGAPGTEPGES
jgi:type IV pilus assembly protein PilC